MHRNIPHSALRDPRQTPYSVTYTTATSPEERDMGVNPHTKLLRCTTTVWRDTFTVAGKAPTPLRPDSMQERRLISGGVIDVSFRFEMED